SPLPLATSTLSLHDALPICFIQLPRGKRMHRQEILIACVLVESKCTVQQLTAQRICDLRRSLCIIRRGHPANVHGIPFEERLLRSEERRVGTAVKARFTTE